MFLAFIMSVAMPIFYERKISLLAYTIANANIPLTSDQSAESLDVSMALAFLCWNAPSMATGLMTGMGGGLSAGSLQQIATVNELTDPSKLVWDTHCASI